MDLPANPLQKSNRETACCEISPIVSAHNGHDLLKAICLVWRSLRLWTGILFAFNNLLPVLVMAMIVAMIVVVICGDDCGGDCGGDLWR